MGAAECVTAQHRSTHPVCVRPVRGRKEQGTVDPAGARAATIVAVPTSTRFDVIARCPLFAELDDDDVAALAAIAVHRSYEEGATLFLAGDAPEGLHVVSRGAVKISVLSPASGREVVLTVERRFQSVAELPSFDGGTYPAHGQAMEPTETVMLPHDDLRRVLAERPTIAWHLLRTLGRRLRRLVGLVEQISFQEVVHRLAGYLLERAEMGVPFELETNASIASQIGTVPELVSRNLARLADGGAIRLDARRVTHADMTELTDLAASAGR